jgi:hypothetical protein
MHLPGAENCAVQQVMQAGDAVALGLAHADMQSGGTQREVVEVSAHTAVVQLLLGCTIFRRAEKTVLFFRLWYFGF